jgi:glycosyltransferase involved in cell wall biosynthesis
MKIAIVHDLLVKLGWAEKVIEKLLNMYPEAHLYTLIYDEKKVWKVFPKAKIKKVPSITQNIYDLTKNQRFCLPFMSRGVESLDLSEYNVVIASNSAFIHGCITKPETKFIVYYHTPARYMWDRTNEYKKEIWWNKWIKLFILNSMLKSLRQWDYLASQRHDITLANSKNVAKRIKKYYGLESEIVYPNVDIDRFNKEINTKFENSPCYPFGINNYYIIISALTEFKRIDISIEAFNKMNNKNLIVVWTWNYKDKLEWMVKWENIKFVWYKWDDELVYLLQNAKWLVFSGEEDFWIVPIESFWAWVPVFAYKWGWLEETMIEWVTWEFFLNKNWDDFIEKFEKFENNIKSSVYKKEEIQKHSEIFSDKIFEEKIRELVSL